MQTIDPARLALCLGLFGLLACDQPRPRCSVAAGDFATTYRLREDSPPCAGALAPELLSVQPYYSPRSSDDQSPDYDNVKLGIQPQSISSLLAATADVVEPNPADLPYALGTFRSARPDSEDYCTVPTLSVARLRLPAIPAQTDICEAVEAQPAVDVRYEFRDVRVYVTPGAYGTQLTGELTYTANGCTQVYDLAGVYPAIECASAPPPEMDAGMMDAMIEDPVQDAATDAGEADACPPTTAEPSGPPPTADDTACGEGSGISPEFAVRCDPELLHCVLAGEPPSLR